jgi:hypothetical protein
MALETDTSLAAHTLGLLRGAAHQVLKGVARPLGCRGLWACMGMNRYVIVFASDQTLCVWLAFAKSVRTCDWLVVLLTNGVRPAEWSAWIGVGPPWHEPVDAGR